MRTVLHGAALLEVGLETGRTHQIRVHLSELGHPLLGDTLYGGTRKGDARVRAVQTRLGRQALHAWRLVFPHPRTGKTVRCEAPSLSTFARRSSPWSAPEGTPNARVSAFRSRPGVNGRR